MGNDLKFALRTMLHSPGFTAVAVLTLALGIGANTAVFTVANGLLLRPLDYSAPDRLMQLTFIDLANGSRPSGLSFPLFQTVLERSRSFSGLAAYCNESLTLTGLGEPEQLQGARVSWSFFDVLGVRPALGRWFSAAEDHAGGGDVTVVSHDFWTRRLGGAHDAVGRTVTLDSRQYTVIGVLPPGFTFSLLGTTAGFWLPRVDEISLLTPQLVQRGSGYLRGLARLAPGVQRENALAEMAVINLQFRADHPGRADTNPRLTLNVDDLQGQMVANVRTAVLLLTGAVGVVLLIACANVASLLLSRALGRRKEIALRGALGAGRGRLVRQLLTESLLLAAAGGALGILFGKWGTVALQALGATTLPNMGPLHMDARVLAFTLGVSLISGAIFGLAPALASSRPDLNAVLRDESRGAAGSRGGARTRGMLVIAQVALSMMLLVGSGLLIRSFYELRAVNPGFDPANLLTMRVVLSPSRYSTPAKMIAFYDEALRRVRSVPGVIAASISSAQPATPTRFTPVLLEGQPQVPLGQRPFLNIQMLSPDWAATLRVPLLRGREFTPHDNAEAPPVALVNQALARRYWPGEDAIGKKVTLGYSDAPLEVVGLVGDVKNTALAAEPQPEVIIPYPQRPWALLNLTVRTPGDPRAMTLAVQREVAGVDPEQAITNVQTMEDILDAGRNQTRFTMFLLGGFAAAALGLSLVGIYGAIAYSVAQRTRELGIRLALGAQRPDILRLAVGQGIGLALVGIALGLVGAAALTRVLSNLLYRISATDPLTLALSALMFLTAALAAGYVPARRAMRIDPGDALRYE
jgi:putative ABC transport system permease protein